jgi:hypothetical protein
MKQYQTLIADLKVDESSTEQTPEYKEKLQTHFKSYSAFSGLQPSFLKAYTNNLIDSGSVQDALSIYPQVLRSCPNSSSLDLWMQNIEMLELL